MPVAGELIGGPEGCHLTDLFDDREAKAVMTGVLFSLVEAGEHPFGIEGYSQAGIADTQAARFQGDIDNALGDVVVAGVAEQVVEKDIDQFGACVDGGR